MFYLPKKEDAKLGNGLSIYWTTRMVQQTIHVVQRT